MSVHQVRGIDDHHLVTAEPGSQTHRMDEVTDLLDDDFAAIRFELHLAPVRMAAGGAESTGFARFAWGGA